MSQKPNSDNLSGNPVPNEDDVLSEYQNMASKDARESSNISNQSDQLGNAAKAGEIDKAKNTIDQNIEGAQNAYSNPGSASNPNVIIYPVLKASYEDMQEDLKKYAGKVKPEKEINRLNGGKQMVSTQFEDANQKNSQYINMIINTLKKIGELRMGIVGKMKDGDSKKIFLSLLLIICLVVTVIVVSSGVFNLKPESSIPDSSGANQPENNPLELVLVTPSNPVCSISFTNPIGIAELPNFGPMLFEWTNVPEAYSYSLEIAPPAETSLPWIYSANDNSRKIYMENFPMGGTFLVSISALSENKDVLCTATIKFDKTAFLTADKEKSEGAPCVTTGMANICP